MHTASRLLLGAVPATEDAPEARLRLPARAFAGACAWQVSGADRGPDATLCQFQLTSGRYAHIGHHTPC